MSLELMGTETEDDRNVKKNNMVLFLVAVGTQFSNPALCPVCEYVCVWDTSEFLMSQRTGWVTV